MALSIKDKYSQLKSSCMVKAEIVKSMTVLDKMDKIKNCLALLTMLLKIENLNDLYCTSTSDASCCKKLYSAIEEFVNNFYGICLKLQSVLGKNPYETDFAKHKKTMTEINTCLNSKQEVIKRIKIILNDLSCKTDDEIKKFTEKAGKASVQLKPVDNKINSLVSIIEDIQNKLQSSGLLQMAKLAQKKDLLQAPLRQQSMFGIRCEADLSNNPSISSCAQNTNTSSSTAELSVIRSLSFNDLSSDQIYDNVAIMNLEENPLIITPMKAMPHRTNSVECIPMVPVKPLLDNVQIQRQRAASGVFNVGQQKTMLMQWENSKQLVMLRKQHEIDQKMIAEKNKKIKEYESELLKKTKLMKQQHEELVKCKSNLLQSEDTVSRLKNLIEKNKKEIEQLKNKNEIDNLKMQEKRTHIQLLEQKVQEIVCKNKNEEQKKHSKPKVVSLIPPPVVYVNKGKTTVDLELEKSKAEIEGLKQQIQDYQDDIELLNENMKSTSSTIERLRRDNLLVEKGKNELQKQCEESVINIDLLLIKNKDLCKEIESLQQKNKILESDNSNKNEEFAQMRKQSEQTISRLIMQADVWALQINTLQSQIGKLKEDAEVEASVAVLQARIEISQAGTVPQVNTSNEETTETLEEPMTIAATSSFKNG